MSTIWVLIEIIVNAFEATYFITIMAARCELKSWVKKSHVIISIIALTAFFSCINFCTAFSLISAYIFPALVGVYFLIFTQGPFLNRFLWLAFPYAILSIWDLLTLVVLANIHHLPLEMFYPQSIYRLEWIVSSNIFVAICWYVILTKKQENVQLNSQALVSFSVLCFVSICFITIIFLYDITSIIHSNIAFFVPICLLFICYGIHFINIQNMNIEDIERQERYNSEIVKSYEFLRGFRYETIESLQNIWTVILNQKNKKRVPLEKHLDYFNQINYSLQIKINTGNDLVDILLSVKEAEAYNHKISLSINTEPNILHQIRINSLVTILDNLLDNAIKYLKDQYFGRIINLSLMVADNRLSVKIEHPTNGENFFNKSEDIKIIHSIVNKCHGSLETTHEEYYYSILISLPYKPK